MSGEEFPDHNHRCRSRRDAWNTSRFLLIVWTILVGVCNIVLCGYIEIVEQQGCHHDEFRLTCPSLDARLAILEAVFTPANSTELIVENGTQAFCKDVFFRLNYVHTAAGRYNHSRRIFADDRRLERNIRDPLLHRCSGVNHCNFVMNLDYENSHKWGPGLIYMKYACMDASLVTKYCNTDVQVGEGFIHTPGYPHFYVGEIICRWVLRANLGQTVELTILDLSFRRIIHPFERDCTDKLIIKDSTGRLLLSTCDQIDNPMVFESAGETLDIYVKTNSKNLYPKRGVLFHYKAVGCVSPPAPRGGYLAWRSGAEAHYMCCIGRYFPGGLRHRTLRCIRGNAWDGTLPPCIEKGGKIEITNDTIIANQTRFTEKGTDSARMLVDVIIPSLLIAALFLGNAVIIFIIFKYRKRKEEDPTEDEFAALTREIAELNGNAPTRQNHDTATNSV